MDTTSEKINKDLILREELAIERTQMANDRTLLSFIRTSLYFAVAGLTVNDLLKLDYGLIAEWIFWLISLFLLAVGIRKYFLMKKKLKETERHVGSYKL